MRTKARRLSVKRVFILGAGASYAATARRKPHRAESPLDKDFVSRLSELNVLRPRWVNDARTKVLDGWQDQRPMTEFGLEDAILRQLGHLEFLEAVHPRRSGKAVESFEWLNHLTHLICYVMRHTSESSRCLYENFVDLVFPAGTDPDDYRDRIVTFNYDDLLDRHVVKRVGLERTYFDKMKENRHDRSYRKVVNRHPFVIKLHGSVNWRCERDQFRRLVKSDFAGESLPYEIPQIWYVESAVPTPSDEVSPLVVPPLPVKPLNTIGIFQYLWTRAYEYLHEAEEIVVCGYSLPPADRLAWSMFGNFKNDHLKEITIVDPHPAIIAKWQELLRRAGVAKVRWTYYDDFADYVQRMT